MIHALRKLQTTFQELTSTLDGNQVIKRLEAESANNGNSISILAELYQDDELNPQKFWTLIEEAIQHASQNRTLELKSDGIGYYGWEKQWLITRKMS